MKPDDFPTATTAKVAEMLDMTSAGLSKWADQIPMDSIVKPRVARQWTLGDIVAVLIADRLMDRGFSQSTALCFVAQMKPRFIEAVDETKPLWTICWPDPDASGGWTCEVVSDSGRGIELAQVHDQAALFKLNELVRQALVRYAVAIGLEPPKGNNDA